MTKYPHAQTVPTVQAGDLLLLLARREAWLLAQRAGDLPLGGLEAWEGTLDAEQRRALDGFDAVVRHNLSHLKAAQRAAGD